MKKYRREALFHARAFLGNEEDAADACQESFTKAFIAFPKLTYLDQFYPWFYRILKNNCLNMINKKKTIRKYETEKRFDSDFGQEKKTPSFILEKDKEQEVVWQILSLLNHEFREILILKYIQEKKYDEISTLLNIPRGTVMSRLYYARKAFREQYLTYENLLPVKEVDR